jgi:hypothetical protein
MSKQVIDRFNKVYALAQVLLDELSALAQEIQVKDEVKQVEA